MAEEHATGIPEEFVLTQEEEAEGISVANVFRADAMTRRTLCGIAVGIRVNGKIVWQGGKNIELKRYGGFHAERTAAIALIDKGYMGKDFKILIERYQDASSATFEQFPGCTKCWDFYNDYGHRNMLWSVANDHEITYSTYQWEIQHVKEPGRLYPETLEKLKPLKNFVPRGNAPPLNITETTSNPNDLDPLIRVALTYKDRGLTFSGYNMLGFDSVAIGSGDGMITGGFWLHSYGYEGYRPEETGFVLGTLKGLHGTDYETIVGLLPQWVNTSNETIGFLASLDRFQGTIDEFAHGRLRLVAIDHGGSIIYDGKEADQSRIRSVLRHTDEGERVRNRFDAEICIRKNIAPRLPIRQEQVRRRSHV
jgi:cytidine deaminase